MVPSTCHIDRYATIVARGGGGCGGECGVPSDDRSAESLLLLCRRLSLPLLVASSLLLVSFPILASSLYMQITRLSAHLPLLLASSPLLASCPPTCLFPYTDLFPLAHLSPLTRPYTPAYTCTAQTQSIPPHSQASSQKSVHHAAGLTHTTSGCANTACPTT